MATILGFFRKCTGFLAHVRGVTVTIKYIEPVECPACKRNQERVTLGLNMVNGAIQILERTSGLNGPARKAQTRTAISMLWRFVNGNRG